MGVSGYPECRYVHIQYTDMSKQFKGQRCEQYAQGAARQWLKENNYRSSLRPATLDENKSGVDLVSTDDITFQVKHQKISEKTGNFSFELTQQFIRSGKKINGNHWSHFDIYMISSDCESFTIFAPDLVDDLFNWHGHPDLHDYSLTELGKRVGARLVWNKRSTVMQSARTYMQGVELTAFNLLVPIPYIHSLIDTTIISSKAS